MRERESEGRGEKERQCKNDTGEGITIDYNSHYAVS